MSRRWFLVYYDDIWHRVPVKQRVRKFGFLVNGKPIWVYDIGHDKAWLMKSATLRILHDFKWWEYPPGRWKFGGVWA